MKIKPLLAALAVAVAGLAGYWYYSPYLAFKAIRQAAQDRNAEAFDRQVDYPRLRASLKDQMAARMAHGLGGTRDEGLASLGARLGMVIVDPMVDAWVSPEMVRHALQQGRLSVVPIRQPDGADAPSEDAKVEWTLERQGSDQLIAYSRRSGQADGELGLVFERHGFSDWKLAGIRLAKP